MFPCLPSAKVTLLVCLGIADMGDFKNFIKIVLHTYTIPFNSRSNYFDVSRLLLLPTSKISGVRGTEVPNNKIL
jgi:hypothetical protein